MDNFDFTYEDKVGFECGDETSASTNDWLTDVQDFLEELRV